MKFVYGSYRQINNPTRICFSDSKRWRHECSLSWKPQLSFLIKEIHMKAIRIYMVATHRSRNRCSAVAANREYVLPNTCQKLTF